MVCEFLEINSIEDEPPLSAAARKSTTYESESPEQVAWLYRAKCLAIPLTAARFEQSRFEIGLQKIRSLACYPDDARHTSKFLADLGVRLVVLQHLPRSKIDGAAFWLDEERERFPVVVLSLRYDRIDYFWHTLMHELIHIKEKHSPSADSGFGESTGGSSTSEDEKQADKEAANLLVPREKLESFIGRVGPLYSMRRIIQFAQARNIHPGIVVGQLQHCGELDYSQLRKALVKVRAEVVSAARTDGWGHAPPVM